MDLLKLEETLSDEVPKEVRAQLQRLVFEQIKVKGIDYGKFFDRAEELLTREQLLKFWDDELLLSSLNLPNKTFRMDCTFTIPGTGYAIFRAPHQLAAEMKAEEYDYDEIENYDVEYGEETDLNIDGDLYEQD